MATNEILEFASAAAGADISTQPAYVLEVAAGHVVGIAKQPMTNKAMKQSSLIAAGVAQFMADNQANNIVDTLTVANIATYLGDAINGFSNPVVVGGGAADVITATFIPALSALTNHTIVVRATAANATTTPTLNANGLGAKTIVKGNNTALRAGDIAGAGHWMVLNYDVTLDKYVLANPAFNPATQPETDAGAINTAAVTPLKLRLGFAISLATDGYISFPTWMGGFIIQWGTTTITSGTASKNVVVNFPLVFPHSCLSISAMANNAYNDRLAYTGSITTTSVTFNNADTNGVTQNGCTVKWNAVGY